jgi:hypothetical protein
VTHFFLPFVFSEVVEPNVPPAKKIKFASSPPSPQTEAFKLLPAVSIQ